LNWYLSIYRLSFQSKSAVFNFIYTFYQIVAHGWKLFTDLDSIDAKS
jgi:hypothetical protein